MPCIKCNIGSYLVISVFNCTRLDDNIYCDIRGNVDNEIRF